MKNLNWMIYRTPPLLVLAICLIASTPLAIAQQEAPISHMDHETTTTMTTPTMQPMDMTHESNGMVHRAMQDGSAPPDARDPHAYSNGYEFRPTPRLQLADQYSFASIRVDRLETMQDNNNRWTTYDLQARYGPDYNRAVIKAEGDYDNGRIREASSELLWGHAVATYWDTQLGLRYDNGEGPNRTWLALGLQGIAPYWFELDTTVYIGKEGRTALSLEAEYEILFSQKLILQSRFEMNAYGKDDAERALGSGLSDIAVGFRLRYEIRREFSPYVGVEWTGKFAGTADYACAAGESSSDTVTMAGVRFWF